MASKNLQRLDHTGLNLIRIVIGSYFVAVSLGLVNGIEHGVMFTLFASPHVAELIGSTTLFVVSAAFITGIRLRITALTLALFVLCTSLTQNILIAEHENVSDFWRDVTLACAILLSYSTLGRREMRRAALFGRRPIRVRKIFAADHLVVPRRITPAAPAVPLTFKSSQTVSKAPNSRKNGARLPTPQENEFEKNIFATAF